MTDLLFRDEVFQIIGAAIEVHKELGNGFLEAVYQEALELELVGQRIPFQSQSDLHIRYKGRELQKRYCADLICFESIIVELKAIQKIGVIEEAQLINYLKATGKQVGLLINFGAYGKLEWKRLVV
jgi:GxxExxY protein